MCAICLMLHLITFSLFLVFADVYSLLDATCFRLSLNRDTKRFDFPKCSTGKCGFWWHYDFNAGKGFANHDEALLPTRCMKDAWCTCGTANTFWWAQEWFCFEMWNENKPLNAATLIIIYIYIYPYTVSYSISSDKATSTIIVHKPVPRSALRTVSEGGDWGRLLSELGQMRVPLSFLLTCTFARTYAYTEQPCTGTHAHTL